MKSLRTAGILFLLLATPEVLAATRRPSEVPQALSKMSDRIDLPSPPTTLLGFHRERSLLADPRLPEIIDAFVEATPHEQKEVFFQAIHRGDVELLQILLRRHVKWDKRIAFSTFLDHTNHRMIDALTLASTMNHPEIIALFNERQMLETYIESQEKEMKIFQKNSVEEVREYLQQKSNQNPKAIPNNCLVDIAIYGNKEILEKLKEYKIDIRPLAETAMYILFALFDKNERLKPLNFLLEEAKISPNFLIDGCPLLSRAILSVHDLETIELLLKKGALVNVAGDFPSPFKLAAGVALETNDDRLMTLLCKYGYNSNSNDAVVQFFSQRFAEVMPHPLLTKLRNNQDPIMQTIYKRIMIKVREIVTKELEEKFSLPEKAEEAYANAMWNKDVKAQGFMWKAVGICFAVAAAIGSVIGAIKIIPKLCRSRKKIHPPRVIEPTVGKKRVRKVRNVPVDYKEQYVTATEGDLSEERKQRRKELKEFEDKQKALQDSRRKRKLKNNNNEKEKVEVNSGSDSEEENQTPAAKLITSAPVPSAVPVAVLRARVVAAAPAKKREVPPVDFRQERTEKKSDHFLKECYDSAYFHTEALGKILRAEEKRFFAQYPIIKELVELYHLGRGALSRLELHRQLTESGEKSREKSVDLERLKDIRNVITHEGTELNSRIVLQSINAFSAVAARDLNELRLPAHFPLNREQNARINELYKHHANLLGSLKDVALTKLSQPAENKIPAQVCKNWLMQTMVPLINSIASIAAAEDSREEQMKFDALKVLFSWCGEYWGFVQGRSTQNVIQFMGDCHHQFRNHVGHHVRENISAQQIKEFCIKAQEMTKATADYVVSIITVKELGIRNPEAQAQYKNRDAKSSQDGIFSGRRVPGIPDRKLSEQEVQKQFSVQQ